MNFLGSNLLNLGQLLVVAKLDESPRQSELIPDPILWMIAHTPHSVGSGIRKIMSRQLESYGINILQLHAEWLQANGYKKEAASCKRQIRMILKKRQAASFKLDNN